MILASEKTRRIKPGLGDITTWQKSIMDRKEDLWATMLRSIFQKRALGLKGVSVELRRPLHISHNLSYIRGIVYCRTCGCYTSSQRVAKLAEPCRMKPRSATGAWQLRRMKDGLHPLGDAHRWPSLPAVPRELAPFLVHE